MEMQAKVKGFIGRKRELAQLEQWLEDVNGSLVFYLCDK